MIGTLLRCGMLWDAGMWDAGMLGCWDAVGCGMLGCEMRDDGMRGWDAG